MQQQTNYRELVGAMFDDLPYRRELTPSDMERMRVPSRYWGSTFEKLSLDGGVSSLHTVVGKYLENLPAMWKAGGGFIFYGANGTGKSCASVVIAKEYRRRAHTVLFMEAADLKRMVIEKEHFDESETFWDRAKSVDVLCLDDFGKGIMDSTGFGASLFDELIRSRNSRKLVTIITANLSVDRWEQELELKTSTLHALKECTIPVHVVGENQRVHSAKKLVELLG